MGRRFFNYWCGRMFDWMDLDEWRDGRYRLVGGCLALEMGARIFEMAGSARPGRTGCVMLLCYGYKPEPCDECDMGNIMVCCANSASWSDYLRDKV